MLRCDEEVPIPSKKLLTRKFKCDCSFKLIGCLLSVGVWSLRVGDEEHNHEMT